MPTLIPNACPMLTAETHNNVQPQSLKDFWSGHKKSLERWRWQSIFPRRPSYVAAWPADDRRRRFPEFEARMKVFLMDNNLNSNAATQPFWILNCSSPPTTGLSSAVSLPSNIDRLTDEDEDEDHHDNDELDDEDNASAAANGYNNFYGSTNGRAGGAPREHAR
jgi:hypothetical protein